MKIFVVPVPVFDSNLKVHSYKFMTKNADDLIIGGQSHRRLDGAVNPKLLETITSIGLDTFTMGKPLFIELNAISLLGDFQNTLKEEPEKIRILLDETVTADQIYIDKIKKLRENGHKIAIDLPKTVAGYEPIIELCDYILVSQVMANHEANRLIRRYPEKRFIASNINTYNMFDIAKGTGYNRFEGSFYRTPLTLGADTKNVSPMKIVTVQLLNAVSADDFELDEIAKIVEKDVALSISLLRKINSQTSGAKIKTIQHAAAMLGQEEVRKWVSTAAAAQLGSDKPTEINRVSLVRAKFCENLAPLFEQERGKESLFLMGLFSLIDSMLDMSMEVALEAVGVSDYIKDALVNSKGEFFPIYEFIQFYEAADWTNVSRFLILYKIQPEQLYEAYIGALQWYKNMIESVEAEEAEEV